MISSADLLILALPDAPNAGGHISAKIYEYMAAGKPVLASVPAGEMSRLVEESRCGWVVPPDRPEAIADKLEFLFKLHNEGALAVNPDADYVGRFTRRKAAEKLAEVIRGLK
jgi:glycosyltransferase involved in cell wall biosynthesis